MYYYDFMRRLLLFADVVADKMQKRTLYQKQNGIIHTEQICNYLCQKSLQDQGKLLLDVYWTPVRTINSGVVFETILTLVVRREEIANST